MSEKDREGGQEPFAPSAVDQPRRGVSRRRVLQTGAAAGVALAWAVPAVEAFASGQAFAAVSPTTPPTNDFVLAVAFSALDPDQNNGEGYFWPLGIVVTSGSSDGTTVYTVNYLTNFSSGDDPLTYGTVYGLINNQLFAFRVDVPPANGDLSAYENGTGPYGTYSPSDPYSNTSGYTQPPYNPLAALGKIQSGGYEGFGELTLAPPSNYPSSQDSAGFDASFDGSSLTINFYVDVVPEGETSGSNFPDIFIYQATVFQPNSTSQGGVETATVISQVWQGTQGPSSASEILLYSSSSGYPKVKYSTSTATGSSGPVNSLIYTFSEFS
jgi:hypothetical protein